MPTSKAETKILWDGDNRHSPSGAWSSSVQNYGYLQGWQVKPVSMTDDRRMTTDRFYGGVSNRVHNLRSMLEHIETEHPSREQLNEWVIANTSAGSQDAVSHHLTFLDSVEIIDLSERECELDEYGERWLRDQNPESLYAALSSGVKGFDTILEALDDGPMTDEDIMDLLVSEFDEAEMSKPGPAVRHREWLQVLRFVERKDGVNRLTSKGHEILDSTKSGRQLASIRTPPEGVSVGDHLTQEEIEEEKADLQQATESAPQLTKDQAEYTESRRRARDTAFTELVRDAYDEQCAICGSARETPDGSPEVEAAHIYPKHKGGSDDVRNGLALCKLHHWAFDTGWLSLSDDYEILVTEAPDRNGYHELKRLEGDSIQLPDNEDANPHLMFVREHRQLHGFDHD